MRSCCRAGPWFRNVAFRITVQANVVSGSSVSCGWTLTVVQCTPRACLQGRVQWTLGSADLRLGTNGWLSSSFHDAGDHTAARVLGHRVFWWLCEEEVVHPSCSCSLPSAGVSPGEYCYPAQTGFWSLSPHIWSDRFHSKWNTLSWDNEEIQKKSFKRMNEW